jgi:drug/metabolite transporter (DMT)-like permease
MKSERALVLAGFAAISIVWGSTWLAIKIGLESISPVFGVAIRFTLAAVILFAIVRIRGERLSWGKENLPVFLVLGFLSFSFPFVLVYWGEQYIGSGLASILFATYPFVVAVFSHLFLPGEPLSMFKVSGTLLGFAGVVVIFWADLAGGTAGFPGMAAIVLSTVLQGFSLVSVKRMAKHIAPVQLTLGGMSVSIVVLWAMAFTLEDPSALRFDAAGVGSIVYLGTFGSVLTFVVYYWLLKRVEALFLSLTSLITPVLAVVLGAIFLGEVLPGSIYTGAAMVLAGILVANGGDLLARAERHRLRFFAGEQSRPDDTTSE